MKNPLNDLNFKYRTVLSLTIDVVILGKIELIRVNSERLGDYLITTATWHNQALTKKTNVFETVESNLPCVALIDAQELIAEFQELIESFNREVEHV